MRILPAAFLLVLVTGSWSIPTVSKTKAILLDSFYNSDTNEAHIRAWIHEVDQVKKQALGIVSPRLGLLAKKPAALTSAMTVVVGQQEVVIQSSDIDLSGLASKTILANPKLVQDLSITIQGQPDAEAILYLPHGDYLIMSDIDDTVRDSQVARKLKLVVNILWRTARPVEMMPALYEIISTKLDKPLFIYISGTPLAFYSVLRDFIANFYPHARGPMILRKSLKGDLRAHKETSIEEVVTKLYPRKKLILIGDSGQEDPEIYAEAYKKYHDRNGRSRVVCIIIRKVPDSKVDHSNERIQKAFDGVPRAAYLLVEDSQLALLANAIQEQGMEKRCPKLPDSEPELKSVATSKGGIKRGRNK